MSDGFETRRAREAGHRDWVVVRLATPAVVDAVVLDFSHFVHNNPRHLQIEYSSGGDSWRPLAPRIFSKPYAGNLLRIVIHGSPLVSRLRVVSEPCGGFNRLRVQARVPMATLEALSGVGDAFQALVRCCSSRRWAHRLLASQRLPAASAAALLAEAQRVWDQECSGEDWLEAFRGHPQLGGASLDSLRKKFHGTEKWALGESGSIANTATDDKLHRLQAANLEYLRRHGFIYIECATGKSIDQVLEGIERRLSGQDSQAEMAIAAGEQAKITAIRINKLITEGECGPALLSSDTP